MVGVINKIRQQECIRTGGSKSVYRDAGGPENDVKSPYRGEADFYKMKSKRNKYKIMAIKSKKDFHTMIYGV